MDGSGRNSNFGCCRGGAERYGRFDTQGLEVFSMRDLEINIHEVLNKDLAVDAITFITEILLLLSSSMNFFFFFFFLRSAQ